MSSPQNNRNRKTVVSRRVVAGLDVRPDDEGRLVVTKGDGYDVRDSKDGKRVRNLGDPVDLAHRYFVEGADEIVFLNIKAGAVDILKDTPMMKVLQRASERIFVPLTIGGGIRSYTSKSGVFHSALDVAAAYVVFLFLTAYSLSYKQQHTGTFDQEQTRFRSVALLCVTWRNTSHEVRLVTEHRVSRVL